MTAKTEQKLQQRLNRISNLMIGNERIWELDRLAMELDVEATAIEESALLVVSGERGGTVVFDARGAVDQINRVELLRADALFLRRLEWDLGELHVAIRGDTARRGGRYDQAEWKGQRP